MLLYSLPCYSSVISTYACRGKHILIYLFISSTYKIIVHLYLQQMTDNTMNEQYFSNNVNLVMPSTILIGGVMLQLKCLEVSNYPNVKVALKPDDADIVIIHTILTG